MASLIQRITDLATRTGQAIKLRGMPVGGLNGQVLRKNSGGDFDASWGSVAAGAGGLNRQLQYNNDGALDGALNTDIDSDGLIVVDGLVSVPDAPDSGKAKLFNLSRAGRERLGQRSNNGYRLFQDSLAKDDFSFFRPLGNGTVVQTLGLNNTLTGTATARNVTNANAFQGSRRLGIVSAATAGASAGTRHGVSQLWRGNAAGLGGFEYVARFGVSSLAATTRVFAGLAAATGAISNVDPSGLVNFFALVKDASDANYQMSHNDGVAGSTKINLGNSFVANTQNLDIVEVTLYAPPFSSSLFYSVEIINTGAYSEGEITTNLFANNIFVGPQLWINNGSSAAAVAIDVMGQYLRN